MDNSAGIILAMTPAIIGQKLDEILGILKSHYRKTDHPDRSAEEKDPASKTKSGQGFTRSDKIQTCLAVLTAAAVGTAVWANVQTRKLVSVAQKTYESSNRPYVGTNGGEIDYFHEGPDHASVHDNPRNAQSTFMVFRMRFKNYGTVPGENLVAAFDPRINGVKPPGVAYPSRPTTMFPSETKDFSGEIGGDSFKGVFAGSLIFQVDMSFHYDGPGNTYSYCVREQFNPGSNDFMDLGAKCGDPWATNKGAHPQL
ncbi:hypothetical protein [Tunturiibacter lichenicola]|uniref:hypothetical protein n=1 Tax=Tunturiibacter lichenicola TaxID=2051959 RepID=UPI0021B44554|nr:hypothetical protein [Edaphobacter lichenicola]